MLHNCISTYILDACFKINLIIIFVKLHFSVQKCLQGLNIAKMYYEAGEMEESLK